MRELEPGEGAARLVPEAVRRGSPSEHPEVLGGLSAADMVLGVVCA